MEREREREREKERERKRERERRKQECEEVWEKSEPRDETSWCQDRHVPTYRFRLQTSDFKDILFRVTYFVRVNTGRT